MDLYEDIEYEGPYWGCKHLWIKKYDDGIELVYQCQKCNEIYHETYEYLKRKKNNGLYKPTA